VCVATNVDHIAKVAVGVVVVVALLFLLVVGEALAPKRPFLVKQAMTLIEVFCCVLLFQLDSDCYCWRRCRWILLGSRLGFCDCGGSIFHVIRKILVEVIRIVVVEIETLRGVIIWFMNFRDENHEDFTAQILNFLVLFA
jgi:hypothetical protein